MSQRPAAPRANDRHPRLPRLAASIAPAVLLLVTGGIAVHDVGRLARAQNDVQQSYRALIHGGRVAARLVDAETAQRGFLLTGRAEFLEPLSGVREDVGADLAALGRVRPAALEGAGGGLAAAARRRLDLVDENVRLHRAALPPETALRRLAAGKALMDSIRTRVDAITRGELARISARERDARVLSARAPLVVLAGLVVASALSLVSSTLFSRYAAASRDAAREAAEANQQLREANDQLQEQAAELQVQAAELEEHAEQAERMRDVLAEREAWFRALIEHAPDLVTVLDPAGTILYESPNLPRVLGYEPGALVGRNGFEFFHPDDDAAVRPLLSALLDDPSLRPSMEYRFRHADGSWRVLEGVGTNLLGNPAVRGLVVNSRDVSERRAAEEALRQKQAELLQAQKLEAVGRLAGGIAHDFNNLLTVIIGNLALASDAAEPPAEELRGAQVAAERAAALVRQLLMFSRGTPAQPRAVDLNEVVRRMEGMLRRVIGEDVRMVTRLAADAPPVLADPVQLEQVVMNLAVNARDAMPDGGTLSLETRAPSAADPARVCLRVADTGHGMDEETRRRLFEPFFTTKAPGKGTGLGLSTVYGIVEQAGGAIAVSSAPGRGTVFEVSLPVAAASAPEPPAEARAAPGGGETVLVVEDEDAVRAFVEAALRRGGYTVLGAGGIGQALRFAGERSGISLLLTDFVMPGASGAEVARAVRELHPSIRTLYMSGYAGNGLPDGSRADGDAFLEKPFDHAGLMAAVRSVLDGGTRP